MFNPQKTTLLQIALPLPIRQTFDYLLPEGFSQTSLPPMGVRVLVPFGKKKLIGLLVGVSHSSEIPAHKLKQALTIIDQRPVLTDSVFKLLQWASRYYHHSLGEVIKNSLPKKIREGEDLQKAKIVYHLHPESSQVKLSPIQKKLALLFSQYPEGLSYLTLKEAGFQDKTITALEKRHWMIPSLQESIPSLKTENSKLTTLKSPSLPLQPEQKIALERINTCDEFKTFLLDGVTGSGKTEIYLQAIEKRLQESKQALVLVPEIALTPQTISRFQARFSCKVVIYHSQLNDQEKWNAWTAIETGEASIIIGTRSAIFTPLKTPGIIILDEEHDPSFKQQTGFRYSARDLAIVRGSIENIPIILGSATPSLESFYNVQSKKFIHLTLKERANQKPHPHFYLSDSRNQKLNAGLSHSLLKAIEKHLKEKSQVLIFLNRRGFSPVLLCHHCSWVAVCKYCDAKMVWHQQPRRLFCHHCSFNLHKPSHCPECRHSELLMVGTGTERLEEVLSAHFKDYSVIRMDKDSTRLKGSMETLLNKIRGGSSQILIGTQMLAKGHHFPNLTLVAVLDGDSGLYSADFKASEHLGQLIIQVAGRAGRGEKPGEVYIQTHHPEHPWLQALLQKDYQTFASILLTERQTACLPPFHHLAIFRAEAKSLDQALHFLKEVKLKLSKCSTSEIHLSSPVPAWMERKANIYRAILLISAPQRSTLHACLKHFTKQTSALAKYRVSWSLEIDPIEIL